MAAGAWANDGNGIGSGHARVFEYTSGSWTQLGSDIDGENADDHSGSAYGLSLSHDGTRVALGSYRNDGNGINSGHVRVFEYINNSWTQMGSDIDGETAGDGDGTSLSLSSNGLIVATGASNTGRVSVFEYVNNSWRQMGNGIDEEAAGDHGSNWFGVSLSSNGSILAIGGPGNDGNGNNCGHVRIFKYINDSWTQMGNNIEGEAAGDQFGWSTSLSSDGSRVAIGALYNDDNGLNSGHVRIFEYVDNSWKQLGSDIDGKSTGDQFGTFVSLSSDGTRIAIGGPNNDGNGSNSGHARVYEC